MAKKIKEFENKLKVEYNINFEEKDNLNVSSKGFVGHYSKENNKETEEENKNNPVAAEK